MRGTSRVLAASAAVVVFGTLGFGTAQAGKPGGGGGGGVDSGIVYFDRSAASGLPDPMWTMNPDGTGQTELAAAVASAWNGSPSHGLHGGRRLFLAQRNIAGETYPGSTVTRREYYAVRDDGAVVTQLTTQSDLMSWTGARWSPDDATISWPASRWVDGSYTNPQVYTAAVVFDAAGNVSGLASQPSTPAVTIDDADGIRGHDWSPDGTRLVAHTGSSGGALWIVELASGATTQLPTRARAMNPAWSPDGSRIAFVAWDGNVCTVRTIAPDGTRETALLSNRVKGLTNASVSFDVPQWSPHGTHLAYRRSETFVGWNVWRVAADGSSPTNLAPGLPGSSPLGWR